MSMSTNMKVGDTAPALVITCLDGAAPVSLAAATSATVNGFRGTVSLFQRSVTVGSPDGVVTMPWQAGDTSVAGTIYVAVTVTWNDGTIQTFPAAGFLSVVVAGDQP